MAAGTPPKVWDVVRVPFPYTDRPVRQHRPALVIAAPHAAALPPLLWVLMITSTENRGWPGDVAISDHRGAGLPAPSLIRTEKIATIDARHAESLGSLGQPERAAVTRLLKQVLADAGWR